MPWDLSRKETDLESLKSKGCFWSEWVVSGGELSLGVSYTSTDSEPEAHSP